MNDEIDDLLDGILVDAHGDAEELTAFAQAFQDLARFPFPARIVGTSVDVTKVEFDGNGRRGLTAVCRREGESYRVALSDLMPDVVTMETARLLDAHRRWTGLPPLTAATSRWVYRPVAANPAVVGSPLALQPMGTWDPADQYWGEEGAEIDPVYERIIRAGPRPQFEMEQVIPGVDPDEWDADPVADAAELYEAGDNHGASQILNALLAQDTRCLDAWVHLGNIAFDTNGPKAALDLYDTAVAIAEQSLPEGFAGVLPRSLIDNRPFLRALHGLGLCAWRQRRWDDATLIYTNLVWIDGCQTWNALECLQAVEARQRWTRG